MSDPFTNPDPRLRPNPAAPADAYASRRVRVGNHYELEPYSYRITQTTFPALHTQLSALQLKAGIPHYQMVAVPYLERGAFIDPDNRIINIGINHLNTQSFSAIVFAFSHEFGHGWRTQHPHAPSPGQVARFPAHQQREVEADIFARCLTQDKTGAIAALRQLGRPKDNLHPLSAARAAAVATVTEADCSIFNLPPAAMPYLPKLARTQKP